MYFAGPTWKVMFSCPVVTSSNNHSVRGALFLITLPPASSRWRSHHLLRTQMLTHSSLLEVSEAEMKQFVFKPPNIQSLFRSSHDAFYPQLIMTASFPRHWSNCSRIATFFPCLHLSDFYYKVRIIESFFYSQGERLGWLLLGKSIISSTAMTIIV